MWLSVKIESGFSGVVWGLVLRVELGGVAWNLASTLVLGGVA